MVSLHLKQKNIQKPISASADTSDMEISKKLKNKNKKKDSTIADKSPFTQHFKDIQRDVSMDIEDKFESESLSEENEFYCPEYIDTLLKRYMPYCFVWSGFVLKNLNNENTRTRFTNGTVENHFYSNKGMGQFIK